MIRVSTRVFARAPDSAQGLVRLPLAFSLAEDETGKTFVADPEGVLHLQGASGEVRIFLDSKYFQIRKGNEKKFSKVLSAANVKRGGDVEFTDDDAPLEARMCRAHLDHARKVVIETLSASSESLVIPRWFFSQVRCEVDFDEGCNAGWDGNKLVFHRGSSRCRPASQIADLIYHEYGHGVAQNLLPGKQPPDDLLAEGAADAFATALTGDPHFGVGFWTDRQMSWLRDLSQRKIFPTDYRGTYTGAQTFSSAHWELREALIAKMGAKKGRTLSLQLLLLSLLHKELGVGRQSLVATAETGQRFAQRANVEESYTRIFAEHGLLPFDRIPPSKPALALPKERAGVALEKLTLLDSSVEKALVIADGSKEAPGPWTEIPFCSQKLNTHHQTHAVYLSIKIDHGFSDDLQIAWKDPGGKIHEFFKGEEELPLPEIFRIPGNPTCGSILVRDLNQMFTGNIHEATLWIER